MPEIKHQFTGGKMNKDLDERLVPNGEYRDAMNIQVSTSEDSEAGTIQNILGNSLVPGQEFINSDAYCVGSIADEKNDKLYYFIDNSIEIMPNTKLEDSTSWVASSIVTDNYSGTGVHLSTTGTAGGSSLYPNWRQDVDMNLVDGKNYKLNVDFSQNSTGGSSYPNKYFLFGFEAGQPIPNYRPLIGTGSNVPAGSGNAHISNGKFTHNFVFDKAANDNYDTLRFYIELTGGFTSKKSVRLNHISLKQQNACIIEYDSKTNSITPVMVDTTGMVLNFSSDKLITGINIIDDMLFWTDNHSEPKKINIPRSINGTDSSGLIHSKFINEKTSLQYDLKEEHITVLKKSPKQPPSIDLIEQRDPNFTYSARTRITTETNAGDSGIIGSNYDFRTFTVGSEFEMDLHEDINGDSGFSLQWQTGDIVAIKSFDGEDFDETPDIPLQDYNIKAEIISSTNNFTDLALEQLSNPNFENPSSNGVQPSGFTGWFDGSNHATYNSLDQNMYINSPGDYKKMYSSTLALEVGAKYKLEFKVSNYVQGGVDFWLCIPAPDLGGPVGKTYAFRASGTPGVVPSGSSANADGVYSMTFDLTEDNRTTTFNDGVGFATNPSSIHYKVVAQTVGTTDPSTFLPTELVLEYISLQKLSAANAHCKVRVLSIPNNPPVVQPSESEMLFAVDKLEESQKIFEFKFPRIAYRYRYQDNEYSAISPFSQVVFAPGAFNYHPKEGYNLGMANKIKQIDINNLNANIPDGVTEIDIVYKEETSPNLYVVDTIKPILPNFYNGQYSITSEQIYKAISSNQILRPWDNVPKTALAQEIVGSRVVYANYTQGFDLKFNGEDYYPNFSFNFISNDINNITLPSVKSLREYQIGAVFVDEYGRETPVITSPDASIKINKESGDKQNKLKVSFQDYNYPEDLKYIKFFIKETSGEYYNLAMDRWYNAEDSQLWLSFPSSDRNKVDIDDFLILKKGVEKDELVKDEAKYKILDIQNEAPDFIKQKYNLIESLEHDTSAGANIFGSNDLPILGKQTFKLDYEIFARSLSKDLEGESDNHELHIEFIDKDTNEASERYKINKISDDFDSAGLADAQYTIMLNKKLGDDVNWISNDVTGTNPTFIKDGITVQVYTFRQTKNTAKFDGRFFVKINTNAAIDSNVFLSSTLTSDTQYRLISGNHVKRLYSMGGDHKNLHRSELTGQTLGRYESDFGRFAPYFRNYTNTPGGEQMTRFGTTAQNVGQYKFGGGPQVTGNNTYYLQQWISSDWRNELAYITVSKNDDGLGEYWTGYNSWDDDDHQNEARRADSNYWTKEERVNNTVWFIDAGPYQGTRTSRNTYSNLWFGNNHLNPSSGLGYGITEDSGYCQFDIAIGGVLRPAKEFVLEDGQNKFGKITHSWDGTSDDKVITNFWNVGETGGNNNYDTQQNTEITESFSKDTKFRFREDPTNQVYTQTATPNMYGRVRYDVGDGAAGNSSEWLWENVLLPTSPSDPSYNEVEENWTGSLGTHYADIRKRTAQLAPNFSSNFRLKAVNSTNVSPSSVIWNPSGALGPITNGLKLTTSHSSYSLATDPTASVASYGSAGSQTYVCVDSLSATNHDGTTHSIQVGMILTSYSGSITLHGSSDDRAELLIYKIEDYTTYFKLFLCGYRFPLNISTGTVVGIDSHHIGAGTPPTSGGAMTFEQPAMNGYTQYSCNRINAQDALNHGYNTWDPDSKYYAGEPGIMPVYYHIEFVEAIDKEATLPSNPAIWETEPKKFTDLDVYYEASGYNPLYLDNETKHAAIPLFSHVTHQENPVSITNGSVQSVGYRDPDDTLGYTAGGNTHGGIVGTGGWYIQFVTSTDVLVGGQYINIGDILNITKPDGSIISVTVTGWYGMLDNHPDYIFISDKLYGVETTYTLNWHNCFAFGNGVESNRVRDNFNLPFITNGVKASTTLEFSNYKEEHRKYGLIYSGLYNANSGINNLNQFIAAEKITKDINPTYGSIQKLFTRDTDLITLCEDKVLQILASKDAVFNADGNPQLVATNRVLGQSRPFVGEYGISTNPESFASESYRAYFADKVRGVIVRLSKDGLTPISDHGMKDWFKDNLSLGTTNLLGENNLSSEDKWDIPSTGNSAVVNGEAILGYYNSDPTDSRAFRSAKLTMNNVLEIGKKYRVQFDVVEHSGLQYLSTMAYQGITVVNNHPGSGWISGFAQQGKVDGDHVNATWVANSTDFSLLQYQVSTGTPPEYDGTPTMDYVNALGGNWAGNGHFYGGIVRIKNIIVEEVKEEELKVIGSYDDNKNEYNVTIHSNNANTVSFKENPKGWVSFKSFIPENALSCANDYYTLKNGRLWQHHNTGVNRNTFYNEFTNSSFATLLNDIPSSIKSYHTLEYEGSQSKVNGIKTVEITGIQHTYTSVDGRYAFFEVTDMSSLLGRTSWNTDIVGASIVIKQYRENVLIYSGLIMVWDNTNSNSLISPSGGPTKGHCRRTNASGGTAGVSNPGDFEVGDIITSQFQEDSVNTIGSDVFNSTAADGWFVSNIETNKEKGSLPEFIEKEGKWFNNVKGVSSEINELTDFGAFNIQGLGIVTNIESNKIYIDGDLNSSLQVGDTIYYENPSQQLGFVRLESNKIEKAATVTNIIDNSSFHLYTMATHNLAIGDYCFFVKDQVINTGGLSGYYMQAHFENDSKEKAELFAVSSEITESSK